jgi:hypothetical protein
MHPHDRRVDHLDGRIVSGSKCSHKFNGRNSWAGGDGRFWKGYPPFDRGGGRIFLPAIFAIGGGKILPSTSFDTRFAPAITE